tara:strand:- start:786 stop:1283 length:498 start_codon:yes stop_codon:yes gene_type:complete
MKKSQLKSIFKEIIREELKKSSLKEDVEMKKEVDMISDGGWVKTSAIGNPDKHNLFLKKYGIDEWRDEGPTPEALTNITHYKEDGGKITHLIVIPRGSTKGYHLIDLKGKDLKSDIVKTEIEKEIKSDKWGPGKHFIYRAPASRHALAAIEDPNSEHYDRAQSGI